MTLEKQCGICWLVAGGVGGGGGAAHPSGAAAQREGRLLHLLLRQPPGLQTVARHVQAGHGHGDFGAYRWRGIRQRLRQRPPLQHGEHATILLSICRLFQMLY